MHDEDRAATVASEWVAKAENDLTSAAHLVKLGRQCPTDSVCFHAQQVVEKYIKALLTVFAIPFPKTHDIRRLIELLPPTIASQVSASDPDELTNYATGARYPGYAPIALRDTKLALKVARRIRRDARKLLPARAKRKPQQA